MLGNVEPTYINVKKKLDSEVFGDTLERAAWTTRTRRQFACIVRAQQSKNTVIEGLFVAAYLLAYTNRRNDSAENSHS